MDRETYGTVKVIDDITGKPEKEVGIIEYFQMDFIGGRHISVVELEDGNFLLSVENPISSGRNPMQTLVLTRESFIALGTVYNFFFSKRFNGGVEKMLEELKIGEEFHYSCSPNLSPDKTEKDENNTTDSDNSAGVSGACGF